MCVCVCMYVYYDGVGKNCSSVFECVRKEEYFKIYSVIFE